MWNTAMIVLGVAALFSSRDDSPTAYPPQGPILGTTHVLTSDDITTRFLGIPYAAPPVGELRFQKPQPHSTWNTVYNASHFGDACLQNYVTMKDIFPEDIYEQHIATLNYSEDCLSLNIFFPGDFGKRDRSRKLPVLVFVHGGAFVLGSASFRLYEADSLALSSDAVLVTIQYRLNLFGFISTGNDDAPGNLGLFDQRMALQWVQDNIEAFQGDPDKVTLIGESAGSLSVNMHMLSSGSHDLFHQTISLSGASSRHQIQGHQELVTHSVQLFEKLNCSAWNTFESVACLQNVPGNVLLARAVSHEMDYLFTPSIDGDFLLHTPEILISTGHIKAVPSMWGGVPLESHFLFRDNHVLEEGISGNEALRYIGIMGDQFLEAGPFVVARLISSYFQKGLEDNQQNLVGTSRMMSDGTFEAPKAKYMEHLAKQGQPVYELYLTHRPSFLPSLGSAVEAQHGDFIYYLFGCFLAGGVLHEKATPEEMQLTKSFLHAIKTFAWTGGEAKYLDNESRNHLIPRYTHDQKNYIELSVEEKQLVVTERQGLWWENKLLWNEILPKTKMPESVRAILEEDEIEGEDGPIIIGSKTLAA